MVTSASPMATMQSESSLASISPLPSTSNSSKEARSASMENPLDDSPDSFAASSAAGDV